jgi:hypothetical protein
LHGARASNAWQATAICCNPRRFACISHFYGRFWSKLGNRPLYLKSLLTRRPPRMEHNISLITTIAAALGSACCPRHARRAPAPAGPGRLSRGRRHHRPGHARLRGRRGAGFAAGRDRRDAADVRRRPALLARRPDGSERHRPARRGPADRGRDPARHGLVAPVGLEPGRGPGVRPGAVGGQYRGAAAGAGRPGRTRFLQRPHRGRLAGGRRPGDGAGAGAAAGAVRHPGRQERRRGGSLWGTLAWTLLQVGAFVAFMLVVGRKLFPWFLWRWPRPARASCSRWP